MHMSRRRPVGVKREDLALWLSELVNDAVRDATEAGLGTSEAVLVLRNLDRMWGGRYVRSPLDDLDEAKKTPQR